MTYSRNYNPSRTVSVFAYGSNLDEDQMGERCPSSYPTMPATLPGYRLAFQGHSRGWGGGVATVVRDPSADVVGMIYEMKIEDLKRLDRFEGHPFVYRRGLMPVVAVDGTTRMVQVYQRNPGPTSSPSEEYFETIAAAYDRLGFDGESLERAARGDDPRATSRETLVFVYGSLLEGLSNHRVLSESGRATKVRDDKTLATNTMLDLGYFPGVVRGGTTAIVGEVWSVDRDCLKALDRLEGHPNFYRREAVELVETRGAVTYFLQDSRRSPTVKGGDWRAHLRSGKGSRGLWRT